MSQGLLELVRGSRGSLLTRVAVGGVTGVSHCCQCPTGCQGMSGVVRGSPFNGVEMRGVTGVSQACHRGVSILGVSGCVMSVLGSVRGLLGGSQRSQDVLVHWGGREGCHRGVGVQGYWGMSGMC